MVITRFFRFSMFLYASMHSIHPNAEENVTMELDAWMRVYGKVAETNGWLPRLENRENQEEEYEKRFMQAKMLVAKLQLEQPDATFTTNSPFTLLSVEEYMALTSNLAINEERTDNATDLMDVEDEERSLERSNGIDWSQHKCMPPIQNQGLCGVCWAFAAVAAVEATQCIDQTGIPVKYSENSVAACSQNTPNTCQGGLPRNALRFIKENKVCFAKDDDPYRITFSSGKARLHQCNAQCARQTTGLRGFRAIKGDQGLIKALNNHPVLVSIVAGIAAFKQYRSGVLSSNTCAHNAVLDHAVLAVGYDQQSIKLRNTFGPHWGEKGYIRFARHAQDKRGTCGMYLDMTELVF